MKIELQNRLSVISKEEQSVLSDNYSLTSHAEPAFANMPLKRNDYLWNVLGTKQPITVKAHTRFVNIPLHSHSYIEMMYVCRGSVTHFIDGDTVILEEGQLLLMNRHSKHSVIASGATDIAVNILISNDFATFSLGKFRNSVTLAEFFDSNSENGRSKYLIFKIDELPSIENLLENLISSSLFEKKVPHIILSDTMSLVFRYLEMYPDALIHSNSDISRKSSEKTTITDYIQTNYRTASLSELSELLSMTPQYVSRLTKELFGASFSELVKEKRMSEAEKLLLVSDLSVVEISEAVGYENNSFFHKLFKEQFGTTPSKWKKSAK